MSAPEPEELATGARVVALPLRVRFRGIDTREALLLRGPRGWGEWAPFVEYDDDEAARWLAAALEQAGFGEDGPPQLRAAVPVNATVPAVPADRVPQVLARFPGCATAKVKVAEAGQSLADDVARVQAVRAALGPAGRVRVDANGAWSVEQALTGLRALAEVGLEYAEQPCATVPELAAVRAGLARAGVPVLVAADESVRKAPDPLAVARAGAADVIVVKVAPLGGVRAALAVCAAVERECGLPVVVSSALDTSLGLAAGVALAAALQALPYACGLGTAALLAADVAAAPLLPVDGALQVAAAAALVVDEELLDRCAAPPERRDWWLARLRRCAALL